tara:strand:+ start:602 stop:1396 length:795 start_codon:yes stop_codon:yes gene_type:complete
MENFREIETQGNARVLEVVGSMDNSEVLQNIQSLDCGDGISIFVHDNDYSYLFNKYLKRKYNEGEILAQSLLDIASDSYGHLFSIREPEFDLTNVMTQLGTLKTGKMGFTYKDWINFAMSNDEFNWMTHPNSTPFVYPNNLDNATIVSGPSRNEGFYYISGLPIELRTNDGMRWTVDRALGQMYEGVPFQDISEYFRTGKLFEAVRWKDIERNMPRDFARFGISSSDIVDRVERAKEDYIGEHIVPWLENTREISHFLRDYEVN